MTPELQRIAIAEACGIHVCRGCNHEIDPLVCHCGSPMKNHGFHDGHSGVPMGCACGYVDADKMRAVNPELPDYLSDLNAMHEAVAHWAPDADDMRRYENALHTIVAPHYTQTAPLYVWCMIHATAAQRAEAFLRTIGKWTDAA